jgi:very-short-patch-repair endonuclease
MMPLSLPLLGEGGGPQDRRVGIMANEIARRLRKTMTPQEVKLWVHLRGWRDRGFHFRRQSPRSGHIVDFVCLKQRLVIEVDGGQHALDPQRVLDETRDQTFSEMGFRILRFWNSEIDSNLSGVLERIDSELRTPPGQPTADHPPLSGEG